MSVPDRIYIHTGEGGILEDVEPCIEYVHFDESLGTCPVCEAERNRVDIKTSEWGHFTYGGHDECSECGWVEGDDLKTMIEKYEKHFPLPEIKNES